jgi:hypothetical protein
LLNMGALRFGGDSSTRYGGLKDGYKARCPIFDYARLRDEFCMRLFQ